ncbi:MAG: flagellar hook-associated protein FlgL [Stellaceae bacterium]
MRISTNEFLMGSLNSILSQESTANQLNQQIASGQAISTAMDNPAGAGQSLNLASQIGRLTYDGANAAAGATSIENGLNALQSVSSVITQLRQVADQAANGTSSNSDRQALAGTVESMVQQLVQLANSQTANGEYLFGGSETGNAPFVTEANGEIAFIGDAGSNALEIAPSLSVPITLSGQNTFMNIPSGNGSFSIAASGANTGTATATPGGVTNVSQLTAEHLAGTEFSLTFGAVNPGGSITYTVASGTGAPGTAGFAATSGVVTSGSYTSGAGIAFGGIDFTFTGTPATGDSFTVAPSQMTTIFQIAQSLASALTAPSSNTSQIISPMQQQQIQTVLSELDSAQTSVLSSQATLGTNLADIQSIQSRDNTQSTAAQGELSGLQSVNLPQVITNYNESLVSLQAAEAAFGRIQNLSLFSVIGP